MRGAGGPRPAAGPPAREGEAVAGEPRTGVLELQENGNGFLRLRPDLERSSDDPYIAASQIRRFGLRPGQEVTGLVRPARGSERSPALERVEAVEGMSPEAALKLPHFADLPAEPPTHRFCLETTSDRLTTRALDLLAPVGKGQRGLIVAPPKAGKTRFLEEIAAGIVANSPDVVLQLWLIDERPEEVTVFRRLGAGQVIAASFDDASGGQLRLAELALARAQRLVEQGRDVFVLVDSLTRLARAANLQISGSGRTLSGGLDTRALQFPRRLFGAARQVEGGGSLTLLATALVETGSRLDDFVFEEFKGTGNWEVRLDRRLAERRLFPAIDIGGSGTRREELLYPETLAPLIQRLRRRLIDAGQQPFGPAERLITLLQNSTSNAQLLEGMARGTVA
jgi:transcription termination factor Rho